VLLEQGAQQRAVAARLVGAVAADREVRALRERRLHSRMILQVHDELVLEVPKEEMDEVTPLVIDTMEGAYRLDAPLKVDAKVGRDWLDMTAIKDTKR